MVPQNVTLFENKVFIEVIKLKTRSLDFLFAMLGESLKSCKQGNDVIGFLCLLNGRQRKGTAGLCPPKVEKVYDVALGMDG